MGKCSYFYIIENCNNNRKYYSYIPKSKYIADKKQKSLHTFT